MHVCPKCHYVRKAADTAPDWQCPQCGIAYAKFGTEGHGHAADIEPKGGTHQAHESNREAAEGSTGHLKLVAIAPILGALMFFAVESALPPMHEAVTVTDTSVREIGAKSRTSVLLVSVSGRHWSTYAVEENPYLINFQHRLEPGDVLEIDATPITRRWKRFTVQRTGEVFRTPIFSTYMGLGQGLGSLLAGICLVLMFYPNPRGEPVSTAEFRTWIPWELLGIGVFLAGFLEDPLNLGALGWAAFILGSASLALIARRTI